MLRPYGGGAVGFGKDVSFFVSMDYAPVHISPCPVDKRAQPWNSGGRRRRANEEKAEAKRLAAQGE